MAIMGGRLTPQAAQSTCLVRVFHLQETVLGGGAEEVRTPDLRRAKAARCRNADVVEHRRWPQSGINKASTL